jgi:flagellar protein FliO/FliZ
MLALTVRLVCSLAVVVGLMLLLAKFAGRRFQGRPGAAIQVMHRQQIGRGQSLAVVSVGTRVLVIGTTEHQISLLTEVEPDELELEEEVASVEVREPRQPRAPKPQGAKPAPLSGSVLSAATWKQAWQAATKP